MSDTLPTCYTPAFRAGKAWAVYIVISLLLIGGYGYLLYPEPEDVQASWDREAEWLGPAKAVAVRHSEWGDAFLLQMDEAVVEDLVSRLGCREMTPEEEPTPNWTWGSHFVTMRNELAAYCGVRTGEPGRMLVTDDGFYKLDPEVEKELEAATPEEALKRHQRSAHMYGIAYMEGDSAGNILLCTWIGPEDASTETSAVPRPIQPSYPQYHKESVFPDWLVRTGIIIALILFFGGMNYIGNGFVSMLGGPFGWWRICLWFLLPLVGWGGFLGLFMLKLTFQLIDNGLPGMVLTAMAMIGISTLAVMVSCLVSLVWFFVARYLCLRRAAKHHTIEP